MSEARNDVMGRETLSLLYVLSLLICLRLMQSLAKYFVFHKTRFLSFFLKSKQSVVFKLSQKSAAMCSRPPKDTLLSFPKYPG